MRACQLAPERRQRLEARAPVVTDAETADLAGSDSASRSDRCVGLGKRPACAGEQCLARFGQRHLAARAREQAHADLLLELPDRHAQRRLCHPQPACRAFEVELLCNGDEVAEMAKLHVERAYSGRYAIDTARDRFGVP
jgi:hypothetical protein